MSDETIRPVSEARRRANAKYDKENYQYITFKAKKGSRERIAQAAEVKGETVNGFIRSTLNRAVKDATGRSMEEIDETVERDVMKGDDNHEQS